jgi:hypothetical protein
MLDLYRQLTGEPDRLGGEVDIAGVALVEDEVQHAQHRGDVTGLVEPDARDGPLGPADALGHSCLGHEVGLRDLTRGQTADGAQRQRDRRGRRQGRVSTQKVQLKRVVQRPGRDGHGLDLDEHLAPPSGGIFHDTAQCEAPLRRATESAARFLSLTATERRVFV